MMPSEIGQIEALYRYPVKSMRGESLDAATLGWHGLEGDRRLALRRVDDLSGFPWLTATKCPGLLLYAPQLSRDVDQPDASTRVRTPQGAGLPVFGDELAAEIQHRHGAPVQMMRLRQGIFDDACISVIAAGTIDEISRLAGRDPDQRRFRPNVVVRLLQPAPFLENGWIGGLLTFGEGVGRPAIAVTMPDVRCSMINLDPDTAASAPEMLRSVVQANQNHAGIYGSVTRSGRLRVGQIVRLESPTGFGSKA